MITTCHDEEFTKLSQKTKKGIKKKKKVHSNTLNQLANFTLIYHATKPSEDMTMPILLEHAKNLIIKVLKFYLIKISK